MNRERTKVGVLAATAALGLAACPNTKTHQAHAEPEPSPTATVSVEPPAAPGRGAEQFQVAMRLLTAHDAARDWDDAACRETAAAFLEADRLRGREPATDGHWLEAQYNAGVAHQRCKHDAEARRIFAELLRHDAAYHRARTQLALYDHRSGKKSLDEAVRELERAVQDARFSNAEALVNLAMLQMQRRGAEPSDGCASDMCRAKKNIQRALAIDDSFMPALNQLAVYYLARAKEHAGHQQSSVASAATQRRRADTQALELAALVCSQALRKTPHYAPVHNTSGLISAELGDLSAAAQSFGRARQLDPRFFEAHMNYAAVNLQYRGFAESEKAYRRALALRPKEYEAHLGLALAIRGQITDANLEQSVAAAERQLEEARRVDPDRPETYYNLAILVQEFRARAAPPPDNEPLLLHAKALFDEFIAKAGGRVDFADAIERASQRKTEIDEIVAFNRQTAKP